MSAARLTRLSMQLEVCQCNDFRLSRRNFWRVFFSFFFFSFSFSSRFFLFIPAFVPLHLLPLSLAETSECVSLFFSFFPPPLFSLCDADYFVPHLWRNLRRQHCIHALIQPRQRFEEREGSPAESNRGPSAYQPNALPLGQTV